MVRAGAVIDSRTIVVEGGATVALRGVNVPPSEEIAARMYLERLIVGKWILVTDGDVYRSPDGLFINGEMIRRGWLTSTKMTYLGEVNPGPRARPQVPRVLPKARAHSRRQHRMSS